MFDMLMTRQLERIGAERMSTVAGRQQKASERKLRPIEIAQALVSMLEMDDRGFTTDLTVWATNPD